MSITVVFTQSVFNFLRNLNILDASLVTSTPNRVGIFSLNFVNLSQNIPVGQFHGDAPFSMFIRGVNPLVRISATVISRSGSIHFVYLDPVASPIGLGLSSAFRISSNQILIFNGTVPGTACSLANAIINFRARVGFPVPVPLIFNSDRAAIVAVSLELQPLFDISAPPALNSPQRRIERGAVYVVACVNDTGRNPFLTLTPAVPPAQGEAIASSNAVTVAIIDRRSCGRV